MAFTIEKYCYLFRTTSKIQLFCSVIQLLEAFKVYFLPSTNKIANYLHKNISNKKGILEKPPLNTRVADTHVVRPSSMGQFGRQDPYNNAKY